MVRYGMVIDISRCTACYNCFTACKDEYWGNDYPPYSAAQPKHGQFWMNLVKKERGRYPFVKVACMPLPCMQCGDAPCIKAARDDAVYRRPDGLVVIDPQKAVGQKQLLEACPYGVIFWNEENNLPQKCTFCVHRLEAGQIPRCVQACPSGCLQFGDLDNPESGVSALLKSTGAEVFRPELNTGPGVYYKDLYKMTKYFIAGDVIYEDTDDCAEGVNVTMVSDGKSMKTTTNNYGIFEFDGLGAGKYTVRMECAGYSSKTMSIDLKTDSYLGDIILVKL